MPGRQGEPDDDKDFGRTKEGHGQHAAKEGVEVQPEPDDDTQALRVRVSFGQ